MTVHFPIVYMFSATALVLLYLLSGVAGFEVASYYCLGAGSIFVPVAMITGYVTWLLNYAARPIKAVRIKQYLSVVLFGFDVILFIWRSVAPDVLNSFTWAGIVYCILIFSLLPLVVVIGWFGAQLTFPLKANSPSK